MAYYGQTQAPSGQQLQQASGGNPFYNPYSPYPNIGMGISSILQNIMVQKQMREQERYQREQEEKKLKLEERRVGAYEEASRPRQARVTLTDKDKMAQAWLVQNPGKTLWDAYQALEKIGKEPITLRAPEIKFAESLGYEDVSELSENLKKSIRARYIQVESAVTPERVPRESLEFNRDKMLVSELESGLGRLKSGEGASVTIGGRSISVPGAEEDVPFYDGIAYSVAEIRNALVDGELSEEDRKRAKFLNTLIAGGGPSEKEVEEITRQATVRKISPKEAFIYWVDWKSGAK
jgi:hypothetical protein